MRLSVVVFFVFSCVSWSLYSADSEGKEERRAKPRQLEQRVMNANVGRIISWSDPQVRSIYSKKEIGKLKNEGKVIFEVLDSEVGVIGWRLVDYKKTLSDARKPLV